MEYLHSLGRLKRRRDLMYKKLYRWKVIQVGLNVRERKQRVVQRWNSVNRKGLEDFLSRNGTKSSIIWDGSWLSRRELEGEVVE